MLGGHPREELLSALADGMLDVAETHRIAQHLHDCERCRATLADFERNKAAFAAMPAPAMPPQQFWDDTFRKMRVSPPSTPVVRTAPHVSGRAWQAAWASAVCLVALFIIPASLHTSGPTGRVHPNTVGVMPAPVDTLDSADVDSFVLAHTDSVANQPLSDPDRQRMIAADLVEPADDASTDVSGSTNVSL